MRPIASKILPAILLCALVCASGCGRTRVVYVKDGDPVRLRGTIKKAAVWVVGADGVELPSEMDIPDGWWALPDEGPK